MTGVQAEDDQAALTGVFVADMMNFAHCTNVVKIEVGGDQKSLTVNRELEGGLNEVLEMAMPAVLTIQPASTSRGIPPCPVS